MTFPSKTKKEKTNKHKQTETTTPKLGLSLIPIFLFFLVAALHLTSVTRVGINPGNLTLLPQHGQAERMFHEKNCF